MYSPFCMSFVVLTVTVLSCWLWLKTAAGSANCAKMFAKLLAKRLIYANQNGGVAVDSSGRLLRSSLCIIRGDCCGYCGCCWLQRRPSRQLYKLDRAVVCMLAFEWVYDYDYVLRWLECALPYHLLLLCFNVHVECFYSIHWIHFHLYLHSRHWHLQCNLFSPQRLSLAECSARTIHYAHRYALIEHAKCERRKPFTFPNSGLSLADPAAVMRSLAEKTPK